MSFAATANHAKDSTNPLSVTISVSVGNVVVVNLNNIDATHDPKVSDATNGDGKDSLGNTYVKFFTLRRVSLCQTVWVSTITTGGSATITGNLNGGGVDTPWLTAQEFSGFSGAATVDKSAGANGTSTSADSGATATTTQADELLIGVVADDFTGSPYTAGSGWTFWDSSPNSSGGRAGAEYQVVSATGTYNATATLSTSRTWSAGIVTIYDAGGGGGSVFGPLPSSDSVSPSRLASPNVMY